MFQATLSVPIFVKIIKCYVTQYNSAYKTLSTQDILNLKDEFMMSKIEIAIKNPSSKIIIFISESTKIY